MRIFSHTMALCSECRGKVQARIVERDDGVYLEKHCPDHGQSRALICSDARWYEESSRYVKPGQYPVNRHVQEFNGCPDSCGLCPEHQQHTCLPVIEITSRCNLNCPVCLKDPQDSSEMSLRDYSSVLDHLIDYEGEVPVVNISGGEPLLHPEIGDMLRMSGKKGIMQATVSTNGIRLLEEDYQQLFLETGAIAALQFDGFDPETYRHLREEDLAGMKREIIEILEEKGIKYSLVCTVANGVNLSEVPEIVEFFFDSNALSLMFQPVAFTGAASNMDAEGRRVTIPDVVGEVEKSRHVGPRDFNPLPCSHYSCFALSYYLFAEEGRYMSLKEFMGEEDYLEVIKNRTLPGLDAEGYETIKEKIYEFWSASDSGRTDRQIMDRIRDVLREMNRRGFSSRKAFEIGSSSMKAIFIHQLMDAETLDFGRLIKCCNHYPQADGRLIPMCACNVFMNGS